MLYVNDVNATHLGTSASLDLLVYFRLPAQSLRHLAYM